MTKFWKVYAVIDPEQNLFRDTYVRFKLSFILAISTSEEDAVFATCGKRRNYCAGDEIKNLYQMETGHRLGFSCRNDRTCI